MSKNIRIAVLGCGRVANHYKKIFQSGIVSDYELVGFHDILNERSKEFSEIEGFLDKPASDC